MPGEKKEKHSSKDKQKKKDKGAKAELPEHLEKQRKYVICGPDKNYHVSGLLHGGVLTARSRFRR